jgi:hypothetical protein
VNVPLERFLSEPTLEDIARELAGVVPATESNPAKVTTA